MDGLRAALPFLFVAGLVATLVAWIVWSQARAESALREAAATLGLRPAGSDATQDAHAAGRAAVARDGQLDTALAVAFVGEVDGVSVTLLDGAAGAFIPALRVYAAGPAMSVVAELSPPLPFALELSALPPVRALPRGELPEALAARDALSTLQLSAEDLPAAARLLTDAAVGRALEAFVARRGLGRVDERFVVVPVFDAQLRGTRSIVEAARCAVALARALGDAQARAH